MADSTSNKVLRFMLSRDIVKGKSREELLAKLEGAGFSGEHAALFIAQAERKARARNRRCALVSVAITLFLLSRLVWGDSTQNSDVRLLVAVMAAIFMASGFYFWFVARWQAAPPKTKT